ncbi:unnamed protein product [Symbiodinium natans]|uniref:Uncharacterized protein n=1 Tax=Symbiodinium natans TaxID=878477 RepID=A0A812HLP7_9DINO|nr:unnamed protein product [Symbiodinium natans]
MKVQRLTAEIQALQASSSLALRRAERCDAAEAETARLQGEVVHLRTEEKRLRLLEERLEQAQSLMQDKESAERRADHATRRADTAEQRAKTLESHAKSLELQLLTVTTDLEAANLAVQEAHDKTRLQSEELTAELKLTEAARSEMEIKLKEVLQELANTNAGNAALRRKVDADILELNAQLSDSRARCERGDVQLEAEREKSQHATNKALLLEDQVAKMQDREMTSNAEVSGLLEENATLRKDLARANAAREAAEQRVAPLASEASKLKDEKLAAEEEAKSCRLQMEATRMAHYEQDRDVRRLQERAAAQSEELERLQTLIAMGSCADDVASTATSSAQMYLRGPCFRFRDELALVRKETPRSGCPALPPAVTRRLASPRVRESPLALTQARARSGSGSRRPSSFASTATSATPDADEF